MAKRPVVITEIPAEVAAQIADEMVEKTKAGTVAAEDGEFQPHLTNAAAPNLGPRRPSTLPPKPAERPLTFDDIN